MSRLLRCTCLVTLLVVVGARGRAEVALIPSHLAFDAVVTANAHLLRIQQAGLARNEFSIERAGALVGMTGQLNREVSCRVSCDVSALQPQDLYVDVLWSNGLGARAGQFLLPLGMDAMTDPAHQKLAGNSFMVGSAKPAWTRDAGLMGTWETGRVWAALAVVNGTGVNSADNNDRKDLCGRIVVKPVTALDAVLALRAYYGWPDALDSLWRSAALEARIRSGPLELQAEVQDHRSQYARNDMAYVLAAWDAGLLEPVVRLDLVLPRGKRTEWMAVGGLNVRPMTDCFKLMFDCSYHRNDQDNWEVFGFHLRLQASI